MTTEPTPELEALCDAYRADARGHADGTPWVLMNMITSVDGAIAIDGLSGGLGNEADFAVFMTLRSLADVILVGSGTAHAENYKVPNPAPEIRAARRSRGQAERPVIALVTRSMRLDLDDPLFGAADYRPAILTTETADADRRSAAAEVAEVVTAGVDEVDLRAGIAELGRRFGGQQPIVLAEGGPTLNAQLAADDVIDELCVTVSPMLVGGDGGRMVAAGKHHEPRSFAVDRAVAAGGLLFTRHLRVR